MSKHTAQASHIQSSLAQARPKQVMHVSSYTKLTVVRLCVRLSVPGKYHRKEFDPCFDVTEAVDRKR